MHRALSGKADLRHPGASRHRGAALIGRLEEQAAPFAPLYLFGRRVDRLRPIDGEYELTTSAGDRVRARPIIIAAGAGAFGPNRPPLAGLPGYEAAAPSATWWRDGRISAARGW